MNSSNEDDTMKYKVVVNHDEQYSIWRDDREIPLGWTDMSLHGSQAECLSYIRKIWTDMRPLSLRKKIED
jgi:MbtH protein